MTLDKWKQAIFRIGFLLEGRSDEEQPEHMLGCGVFYGESLVLGGVAGASVSISSLQLVKYHLPWGPAFPGRTH